MWVLEGNVTAPGIVHYLPCGTLLVSRKDGHVLLQGDNSISRQHASITITHSIDNVKNTSSLPEVKLTDLGAKYGTYINDGIERDVKIASERSLSNGDRVRFGMLTNTWRLRYQPLVVTTSALNPKSKGELQNALVKLGGHLIGEWTSSCSYLVMNNITLTIKVVCALAAARHIVTPDFFFSLIDAVTRKSEHPDPAKFLPPLQEMSINQSLANFSPNEKRKQILSKRTFIFPSSKQLKRMGPAVSLAGGNAVLLTEENFKLVSSENYLLIQLPPEKNQEQERSKLFAAAKEILTGKGLRVIPESDIGLAVLYLSTKDHCNPSFIVSNILRRNGSSSTQTNEPIRIYATETQDVDESSACLMGTREVPESGVTSSRRTPVTLPSTSFPLASSSNATTLMNSSSTSTNASVLQTPASNLPCKSDPEDKENVLKRSNKRLRTTSREFAEPLPKRSSRSSKQDSVIIDLEPTQPLEEQDDDDDVSPSFAEVSHSGVSKFEPKHCSTQRNIESDESRTAMKESESSAKNQGNALDTTGETSVTCNDEAHPLEPTVGRSIPFEPYTLPSLNVEPFQGDDIGNQTEPMERNEEDDIRTASHVTIKEEPPSLPLDEPDRVSGKKRREEEFEISNGGEMSGWLGKKKKITDHTNNVHVKQERSSFRNMQTVTPSRIKQENHEEDFFTLPNTSERSRRRDEAKRKASGEGMAINGAEEDLFNLECSSRAERRKKMKSEAGSSRDVNSISVSKEPTVSMQKDVQIPTSSCSSRNTSTGESKCADAPVSGNWISKKSEGTSTSAMQSPVKAEAAVCDMSKKTEPAYGDVAELSGAFERSLVVVEVASLVRRKEKKPTPTCSSPSVSSGNLKNFKRFRKNASDIISLPKIIGGRDLISHHVANEMARREGWFQENPEVTLLEERETQERARDDELDSLFDLPHNAVSRARMRR